MIGGVAESNKMMTRNAPKRTNPPDPPGFQLFNW